MRIRLYITALLLCHGGLINHLFGQCVINNLINPSFESPVQPLVGDNFLGSHNFNGWNIVGGLGFVIVKTDGSFYNEGPDNASDGTQYVDLAKGIGYVQQNFTLNCPSAINFSGDFSIRGQGSSGFISYIDIINSSGSVVATSSVLIFNGTENQEIWRQVTGSSNLPVGTYTFRYYMDDYANCDNAFLCITPSCVLPVKLNLFEGVVEKCTSKIYWTSESEFSLKEYAVEYSPDGISFSAIGQLNASNKTRAANSYNFIHLAQVVGNAYYRLKVIDLNGQFNYSNTIKLYIKCERNTALIFPNPVTDLINISLLSSNTNFSTPATLYNAKGGFLKSAIIKNGSNKIDVKKLSTGIYYLVIAAEGKNKTYKIIKE